MTKLAKINPILLRFVKVVFVLLLIFVIYYQLNKARAFDGELIVLKEPIGLLIGFLLMPINWTLEGLKWRRIIQIFQKRIGLKTLLFSLFTGISASLFTPNRAGNFVGRMIWFGSGIRVQISILSIYGNVAQWLSTVIFGVLGVGLATFFIFPEINSWYLILSGLLIFSVVLLYVFPYWLPEILSKYIVKRKMSHAARILKQHQALKWELLLLSLLRHFVFSLQFALIMYAFGFELNLDLIYAVWITYFVTTLVPSPLFGKLLLRESAALLVIGSLSDNATVILLSSVILWFINLSIPAILGGVIWLKWRPLN
jgi:uncharacterized membrane protein YbhN (UPF0104 family)